MLSTAAAGQAQRMSVSRRRCVKTPGQSGRAWWVTLKARIGAKRQCFPNASTTGSTMIGSAQFFHAASYRAGYNYMHYVLPLGRKML
ncbi:hypothetical protein [Brucella anthropi]|uniref:hypothetical protein n=1 Tax=Brucella anthropi TaxID=529 RepID=UPI00163A2E21|nr:hypothetical protein [Brucella anthropi]MDH0370094.1 hypothetical protein [Brucella anthropi]